MSKVLVTEEMFKNITYDAKTAKENYTATIACPGDNKPTVLIVFMNSDVNAALHHLVKSLEMPFRHNAVATVLVQESIKRDFVEKLQKQLKPYEDDLVKTNNNFKNALKMAKKLNARIITVEEPQENIFYPTLVCDFNHEQLGSFTPSGVVTLHTFRTAKEAIALVDKESLTFPYVSIWHENHSYAYEIIASLKSSYYFINCYRDPPCIFKNNSNLQNKNYVTMDKSYHYEILEYEGIQKYIVFPIGSIFAN